MTTPLNPYVAGNPVGGSDAFVGRSDVLREVLRVLRRPKDNALVLYGQRRIGKTSILEHLAAWLPREGPYRPVYFDLQDKAAWPLGRVLESLAETIAGSLDQGPPQLSSEVPTSFRETWLPDVLASLPNGSSLVLLFDEFDVLAEPSSEQAAGAFFPYLRGLLSTDPGKLQFIFVIGRNVDDLDTIAHSLFKGTGALRVSLLSRTDTATLVRLSEANGTLHWREEAVERVWQVTNGHPFLTQQLCAHVWERAYDEDPAKTPTVGAAKIDAVIEEVLDASQNTFEWLWDGLPPAERFVTSALADAGPGPINAEQLEKRLYESGVRVLIRDLQIAPRQLEDWDILEPAADCLRFRVELLRRWVVAYKPLHRVQEELDHIEPVAQNLYQAAQGLYRRQNLAEAVAPLRQALRLNPNHQGAYQLLAEILLSQGELAEAREILERFYAYQPAAARPRLVQVLLLQAQQSADDDRLALYEQVLEIVPGHLEANAGRRSTWLRKGEQALEEDDFQGALEAFELAGAADRVAATEKKIASRRLASERKALEDAERQGDYQSALKLARQLAAEFPDAIDWTTYLSELKQKTKLAGWYREALGALKGDDPETARTLLARVVAVEPTYEEASRYLHQAVTGVDPVAVHDRLQAVMAELQSDKEQIERLGGVVGSRQPSYKASAYLRALAKRQKAQRRQWES
ncbi:MAG: tetratricopeptide repeat protein [bacterium]|nr:tetratricopeptide repeat protein [bacterium]